MASSSPQSKKKRMAREKKTQHQKKSMMGKEDPQHGVQIEQLSCLWHF